MRKPAPIRIPNREVKFSFLAELYSWRCPIAMHHKQLARVEDLHHAAIHNTKWARKKYPNFIHSVFNLMPVNNAWHIRHTSFGKWKEVVVVAFEMFLQNHKDINEWANNPEGEIPDEEFVRSILNCPQEANNENKENNKSKQKGLCSHL